MLLSTFKAGDFFGEMSLVDLSPRSATAIATEDDTQLLVLDTSKFLYLLRQQPEFALTIMQRLCQRLREANQTIADLKQAHPKKR
jgi:CRP-like cAMP-binding protein